MFWVGAVLLVLGAVGVLGMFASGWNTGRSSHRWIGGAGVVAMVIGAIVIVMMVYQGISGLIP